MGYDTLLFDHRDDSRLIYISLKENRTVITRDTHIMERRAITTGRLKALLITSDNPRVQIYQVITGLGLDPNFNPFSLCLEDNQPLVSMDKEVIKDRLPPYVYQTQSQYMECPLCHRIYWQGTHWQAMVEKLKQL